MRALDPCIGKLPCTFWKVRAKAKVGSLGLIHQQYATLAVDHFELTQYPGKNPDIRVCQKCRLYPGIILNCLFTAPPSPGCRHPAFIKLRHHIDWPGAGQY